MGLRRRLTILGVILLLGAGVSVAVAWSCAIWHYVGRAPRIAIGSTLEDSTTPWQAAMYHSSLAHRVHSAWGPLVTTQQAGDWPSELMGRSARLLLPQSDEARIAGARVLDRRGWPMRSMWSALELEALAPLRPGSAPTQSIGDVSRVIRGIELSPYPQFGSEAQLHRHRVLPLGIIWRGFAVNTLLFAAMAWFLLVILQYSRRAIRAGAGRCPGCAYELRHTVCDRCPECGGLVCLSRIGSSAARWRRRGVLGGWCALLLASAVFGGLKAWPWVSSRNWDAYKPWWWLSARAKSLDETRSRAALDELITRLKDGRLGDDDVDALVLDALAIQADLEHPWVPQWGDIVTTARSKGLVSDEAWRTFARQAVVPELVVRPVIVAGDVIAARFLVHKRAPSDRVLVLQAWHAESLLGGQAFQMPFNATTQLSLDSGSAGVVRQRSFIHFDFSGRGLFGSILQREGRAAEVEPGTHIFETSWHVVISEGSFVGGTGGYTTTTELYRDKVAIQATVTVLPEGSETVELVADESLRPGVEASLTLMRITAQPGPVRTVLGDGTVFIKASVMTTDVQGGFHVEEPPTDLAFDVFLRAGGREWLVGQIDSDIAGPRDFPWFRGTADGLEDTHVDVILRPSLAAARRTVSITRIWDGEIVLEGVPVQWKD